MVPQHFKQLKKEMEPLIVKIQDTLFTSIISNGQELDNVGQVKMLLNDTHISRLVDSINALARDVISVSTVSDAAMASAIEDLKFALYNYLAGYTELCKRSFPDGLEEGHELTVAVYKRPLQQVLELFENIVAAINTNGDHRVDLRVSLTNDVEVARFQEWSENVLLQLNQPLQVNHPNQVRTRSKALDFFAGAALAYLFTGHSHHR